MQVNVSRSFDHIVGAEHQAHGNSIDTGITHADAKSYIPGTT